MDKHFAGISRNSFLLILFLLATLFIALLLSYLLVPAYKNYIQTRSSYLIVSAELEVDRSAYPDTAQVTMAIDSLRQQMDGEGVNLSSQQFESHVIGELQDLAWGSGVQLGGVRPQTGRTIDHYREVLFNIELYGEYFALYQFLRNLEQAPGSLVVNDLSVSPRQSPGSGSGLEVQLSIASYRQEGQ